MPPGPRYIPGRIACPFPDVMPAGQGLEDARPRRSRPCANAPAGCRARISSAIRPTSSRCRDNGRPDGRSSSGGWERSSVGLLIGRRSPPPGTTMPSRSGPDRPAVHFEVVVGVDEDAVGRDLAGHADLLDRVPLRSFEPAIASELVPSDLGQTVATSWMPSGSGPALSRSLQSKRASHPGRAEAGGEMRPIRRRASPPGRPSMRALSGEPT